MILKSNNLRTFQLPNEQRLLSLRQHRGSNRYKQNIRDSSVLISRAYPLDTIISAWFLISSLRCFEQALPLHIHAKEFLEQNQMSETSNNGIWNTHP